MKKIKSILLLLIILPCLFVFTACGNENKNDNNNKDTLTYNVVFKVDGSVYDTKKVENGGKVPKPENPSKDLYIFAGWYNGETEWDFDNDVVSGNLTLTAKFNKFDNIDKDYIKINNFEVKKDENDEEYYLRKVSNKKTRYNFNDDIFVGEKLKWFVSFDVSGNNEIKSKMAELEIGDNIFYLIVQNDKNDIKQYVLHVYRRQLFEVIFNTNGGGTVEPQTVEEDSLVNTPTEKLSKEGYEFVGWDYNLELPVREDLIISAKYNPIKYTATFKVEGTEFATKTFTVEDSKVPNTPSVPAKTGYTAKWENYEIKTEDITINAIYTPIKYTATFKVEGKEFITKTFTVEDSKVKNIPIVPAKIGYTAKWEDYKIKAEDITINAVYTPIVYTATFKADGKVVKTVNFTVEDKSLTNIPSVPTKTGYTGKWEDYEIKAEDITINAVYTPIVYTATFKADGKVVKTVNFTVEDKSLTNTPSVPTKTGYTGKWENYEIKAGDITINAVYTPIVYTATFKADAKVVKTVNFTVEDKSLTDIPTVPIKTGYTAKWEDYKIKAEDITINAIYTPINYSVIFKNYDGTILSEKKDYHYGDSVIVPSPLPSKPADNICFYNFIGWDSEVVTVTENKIYIAQYEEKYITYTITYHNTYDAVNPNKTTYDYATPTFNISKLSISEFLGWYSDESLTIPAKTTIEKGSYGNLDFYAKWKLTYYSITYILPIEVKHSNPLTYTRLTPETALSDVEIDGYKFLGWYTSNSFDESTRITAISGNKIGDITIYGKYENLTGLKFKENNDEFYVSGYNGTSETVVIPNYYNGKKVSAIGDKAFSGCSTIKNVTIGNNVTSIGNYAFEYCSSLTCVVIPNSVTDIGVETFYNCGSLMSVTIGNSVTTIKRSAFDCCYKLVEVYNLSSLNIEKGSDNYGYLGYYAKDIYTSSDKSSKLKTSNGIIYYINGTEKIAVAPKDINATSIVMDDGCTEINQYAFSGCHSLISVTIPNSVTSIGKSAFSDCNNLKIVTIPNNVTSIGSSAFYNCSSLTSITIGNSVTSIKEYAFYNCSSLTSVVIPNSITTINSYAFDCCYKLVEVYNFSSLNIEKGSKDNGYVGYYAKDIYTSLNEQSKLKVNNGVIYYINGTEKIVVAPEDMNITNIILDDDCTKINLGAFYDCNSLISITIPDSVTSIGKDAFRNCYNLRNITIGKNIVNIEISAFFCCYRLVEVYNLSNLNIEKGSEDNGYVGYYAKDIYTSPDEQSKLRASNGVIYYINGTEKIAVGLEDKNATSIVIDEDCTEINQYAFFAYRELLSIIVSNSVKKIGEGSFAYCGSLTSIIVPNSVINIGGSAFAFCTKLITITIGNGIENFGFNSFIGCINLVNTYYTGTIEDWCSIKFNNYNSNPMSFSSHFYIKNSNGEYEELTEIEIPNTITEINDYAYCGFNNVTKVTIPNNVTGIGKYAFYGCSSLTSVTIGNSVISIGNSAFKNCSSLQEITLPFVGESEYKNTFLGYIFGASEYSENSNYVPTTLRFVTITRASSIGYCAFYKCSSLRSVTIGNNVTSIGESAFRYCSLSSLIIPKSVTRIGNYVFANGYLGFIYYKGTSNDWNKVSISMFNPELTRATRYYYSETKPSDSGNYWHYGADGETIIIW